jgi:hypothetical protein
MQRRPKMKTLRLLLAATGMVALTLSMGFAVPEKGYDQQPDPEETVWTVYDGHDSARILEANAPVTPPSQRLGVRLIGSRRSRNRRHNIHARSLYHQNGHHKSPLYRQGGHRRRSISRRSGYRRRSSYGRCRRHRRSRCRRRGHSRCSYCRRCRRHSRSHYRRSRYYRC